MSRRILRRVPDHHLGVFKPDVSLLGTGLHHPMLDATVNFRLRLNI